MRALEGGIDGKPRRFLARQGVLGALRAALVPDPNPPSVPPGAVQLLRRMDLETAGVLLVHLTASELHTLRAANEVLLGGLPESLAMETVANNLFNEKEDPGSLLARTWLLWHDHGSQVTTPTPRRPPVEMLEEAVGVEIGDLLALAFGFYSKMLAHQPDTPVPVNAFVNNPIDRTTVETFLSRFSFTLDELATELVTCPQPWQLLPIQDRPLLRVGDDVIVLDEQYLLERVTRGLYWLVHDHEKTFPMAEEPRETGAGRRPPSYSMRAGPGSAPTTTRPPRSLHHS